MGDAQEQGGLGKQNPEILFGHTKFEQFLMSRFGRSLNSFIALILHSVAILFFKGTRNLQTNGSF